MQYLKKSYKNFWKNTIIKPLKKYRKNWLQCKKNIKVLQKIEQRHIDLLNRCNEGKPIQIPHYFHATSLENARNIITSKKVEVRHEGCFKGAWVSTRNDKYP